MRNVLSEDERRRITAGKRAEGKAEGRADVKADTVRIVMPKLNMSASEAMTFLEIPESEHTDPEISAQTGLIIYTPA